MVNFLSLIEKLYLLNLFIDPCFFIDSGKNKGDKEINLNVIDYTNL